MTFLRLEFFKGRRRKIPLLCLACLGIQTAWMVVDLLRMEPEELSQGWMQLVYTLLLVDAITLPLTMAALASRTCELEHKENTWKLLETLARPQALYRAKLTWGAILILGMLVVEMALFVCFGLALGFPHEIPWGKLGLTVGNVFLVSLGIYALQLGLSLRFVNQAAPLAVGILGSFAGLFILFFPQWAQRCLPWGYYGVLLQAEMLWDPVTHHVSYAWLHTAPSDYGLLALWLVVLFAFSYRVFVRKEV